MRKIYLVSIIYLVALYSLHAQQIIGYLPYYRGFNPNYNYSIYTHIHYFTIWPDKNGGFIYPEYMDSISMENQFRTISNEAKKYGVKMILTFGGPENSGSLHFTEMAANDSTRNVFVKNVLNICQNWNADGIDIDWEWEQHTDTETSNYAFTSLMQDLRKMADENNLSLSLDVASSSWSGKYYNPQAVNLADYVNVMTYVYNGTWSGTANHHSAMNDIINIGMPYWLNKGIPKEKLNIGTAFFGQLYEGTSQRGGTFTYMSYLKYSEIKQRIANGYLVVEDNMEGSYCYSAKDNKIVFYDSQQNTAFKMNYAIENKYSGIIIWEIGQDDENQTLATSIFNAKNATATKDNHEMEFPFEVRLRENLIYLENVIESGQISIFDLSGKKLLGQEIFTGRTGIKIKNMNTGIYILLYKTNKQVFSKKIVVGIKQ